MASPASRPAGPVAPPLEPVAIRTSLSPALTAEFDSEWNLVLDQAKRDWDLTPVHALLHKWRHIAFTEMSDPGAHFRLLAKAEAVQRTGANPDAVSAEDMRALLRRRLGR